MATGKTYSKKQKEKACKLVTEGGLSELQASKKVGVSKARLSRWLLAESENAESEESPIGRDTPTLAVELSSKIQQLLDEAAVLQRALEILK